MSIKVDGPWWATETKTGTSYGLATVEFPGRETEVVYAYAVHDADKESVEQFLAVLQDRFEGLLGRVLVRGNP